jgi:hypothetical protein
MRAKGMIEGLGGIAGLSRSSRSRASIDESGDVQSSAPMTEEDGRDLGPPPLNEWCEAVPSDYHGYSRERSFEEKIRHGVELIKMAISEEAFKGVGDDGKVMRDRAMETPGPWSQVEKLLSKELYVDRFKPLVLGARAIIDEHME